MAIGERFFDYSPKMGKSIVKEEEYDADFNKDGDKEDTIQFNNADAMFAPDRPWWGEAIAIKINKDVGNIDISEVISYINLHWKNDNTYIYRSVYKIEF